MCIRDRYYEDQIDKAGTHLFSTTVIPNRGAWLEYETDSNDVLWVRIDRARKLPITLIPVSYTHLDGYKRQRIGMPGCGKSTVGVLAAKALTMDFVDTDLLLQRKAGRPLQRMVDELGAEGFAHVEEACVCGLEARGTVIATGGSVATEDAAMEHLKEGGLVIFLRLPLETLSRRLKNMKTRGIAMEKGQTLRDLYERRQPAYLKWADAVVDAEGLGVEETVARVVAAVREREGQTQETEAEKTGKQN